MIGIVGGGLAGTALAKILWEESMDFVWIKDGAQAASHISSGIVNPITGRRFALSWKYDILKDVALDFYGPFMKEIKIDKFFNPFKEGFEMNQILRGKEDYLRQIDENWIEVNHSFQVDVLSFLSYYDTLINNGLNIRTEKFDYTLLKNLNEQWIYKDLVLSKIIFAEGIKAINNPYFSSNFFIPNRGEALLVDIEQYQLERVKKHGKFICSHGMNYWIGSTFDKVSYTEPTQTAKVYEELIESTKLLIGDRPFKVISHLGAFRSTTLDRRPILGEHPRYKNLFVFNGFGTKGVSLIPYSAHQLVDYILDNKPIDSEISMDRLTKF